MASLQLGAASSINESWRTWRLRAQQISGKELRTKHELVRFAKRSESLRYILKQYGVSVEKPEEENRTRLDDLNCEDKHNDVPSSDDYSYSKMKTIKELPDLRRQENYSESVITSGQNHHNFLHLNADVFFTCLLPLLGFCIIGTLHTIISRNLNKSGGRKTSGTRWRSALSDLNESDEHDPSSLDCRVSSEKHDDTDEVMEAYNRVELEYRRFLAECGVSES